MNELVRSFLALHDRLIDEHDLPARIDKAGLRQWRYLKAALVRKGIHVEHLLHARKLTLGERVVRLPRPSPSPGLRGSLARRIRRIMEGVA